jgi:hypothetical protein
MLSIVATTYNKNEKHQSAKKVLNWRPDGRIRIGRPWKRMLHEAEQVYQGLTGDMMMMMMMMISNVQYQKMYTSLMSQW